MCNGFRSHVCKRLSRFILFTSGIDHEWIKICWFESLEPHTEVQECTIFMHGGGPCHKSKVAKQFLESKHIQVLDWPENSHDLNPIKNSWRFLKKKVCKRPPSILSALYNTVKKFGCETCYLIITVPQPIQLHATSAAGHNKQWRRPHKILKKSFHCEDLFDETLYTFFTNFSSRYKNCSRLLSRTKIAVFQRIEPFKTTGGFKLLSQVAAIH